MGKTSFSYLFVHHPKLFKMFRVVCVLVPVLWALAIATNATNNSSISTDKPLTKPTTIKNSVVTATVSPKDHNATETIRHKDFETEGSMIRRALFVLIGITIIGVLYFLVRAVRLKKTTVTQRKKRYGLLSNYDEDEEDDEDDVTVYEARSLTR